MFFLEVGWGVCEKLPKLRAQGGKTVIWANTKLFFLLLGGLPLIATDFPKPVRDVESFIETNHIMLGISATLRN